MKELQTESGVFLTKARWVMAKSWYARRTNLNSEQPRDGAENVPFCGDHLFDPCFCGADHCHFDGTDGNGFDCDGAHGGSVSRHPNDWTLLLHRWLWVTLSSVCRHHAFDSEDCSKKALVYWEVLMLLGLH